MVPVYVIKKRGGRKVLFHSFLTSVADGGKGQLHTPVVVPQVNQPLCTQRHEI